MASSEQNTSTEEKIKAAARIVFMRKGYAATRTRDIAEESGLNLALINYYFRSKENLFNIVMLELCQLFVSSVKELLNDHNTTLQQKVEKLVHHYIDMLLANPGMPFFILNEANNNPEMLLSKIGMSGEVENLYIISQWKEHQKRTGLHINPLHIILNTISMTVFPFAAAPILRTKSKISPDAYNQLMIERKTLIPQWIAMILSPPAS
jgi:AcrR family transcriptional regulator